MPLKGIGMLQAFPPRFEGRVPQSPRQMSLVEMKKALKAANVGWEDCFEKKDFVQKLRTVQRNTLAKRLQESKRSEETQRALCAFDDPHEKHTVVTVSIEGTQTEVLVPESCTVGAMKLKLFADKLTVLPSCAQKLICCSKVLGNNQKIAELTSTKMMLFRDHSYVPSEVNLRLLMPNLDSRPLETFASPTTTVKRLKQTLAECHAFPPPSCYSLFLDGVELADNQQLKNYCLKSSNLFTNGKNRVELQVVPAMSIKVRTKTTVVKAAAKNSPQTSATNPLMSSAGVNSVGGLAVTGVEVFGGNGPAPVSGPPVPAPAPVSTVPANMRTGFMGPPSSAPTPFSSMPASELRQLDQLQISTDMEIEWPAPAVLQPACSKLHSGTCAMEMVRDELQRKAGWTRELERMIQLCMLTQGHSVMPVPKKLACLWVQRMINERTAQKAQRKTKSAKAKGTSESNQESPSKKQRRSKSPVLSKGFLSGAYESAAQKAERRKQKAIERRKQKAAQTAAEALAVAVAAAESAVAASKVAKKAAKKKKPKKFKSMMADLISSKSSKSDKENSKVEANPKIEFKKLDRI